MSPVRPGLFVGIGARRAAVLDGVVGRFAWSHAPLVQSRKIDGMEVEIAA